MRLLRHVIMVTMACASAGAALGAIFWIGFSSAMIMWSLTGNLMVSCMVLFGIYGIIAGLVLSWMTYGDKPPYQQQCADHDKGAP